MTSFIEVMIALAFAMTAFYGLHELLDGGDDAKTLRASKRSRYQRATC